jgi:hypothetical protein
MSPEHTQEFLAALTAAQEELDRLERSSQTGVDSATQAFRDLASAADGVLKKASVIVGCVEKDNMEAALAKVQALFASMKVFLERRLVAASAVLDKLQEQEKLLGELSHITRRQENIAHHLRALSVLTDVEVARLAGVGGDFHVLAQELAAFSKSLAQQTRELAADNEGRKQTVRQTRRAMAAAVPQLRGEVAHMQQEMGSALQGIQDRLSREAGIPEQFRVGAEKTSGQIAGVVAAIQTHDITRQQLEHVQKSLGLIASRWGSGEEEISAMARAHGGLKIQLSQLENVKQTLVGWTSQIGRCMADIPKLSASELMSIGPVVLEQERGLSSQLMHIEQLQEKSREHSDRLQEALGDLSSLMELVNVHLKKSQTILGRLQLLMFNSMIEAHRLRERGAAVSAIANLIRDVAQEWKMVAASSRQTLDQMLDVVKQIDQLMQAFSEGSQSLRDDEVQTAAALGNIRDSAVLVAREAAEMQSIVGGMQANLAAAGRTGSELDAGFTFLEAARMRIEAASRILESNAAQPLDNYSAAELEEWLGRLYTTEIEREVMRAALHGTAMPALGESFAGNSVELF